METIKQKNPRASMDIKMIGVVLITGVLFITGYYLLFRFYDQETLGENYQVFQDQTGQATFEEILAGKFGDQFQPSHSKYLYFGYTKDSVWLKLDLEQAGLHSDEDYWLESIDKLSQLEAYYVKEDGTYSFERRGVYHVTAQPVPYRATLFHMTDPTVKTIYFKLSGDLPLTFISYLHTEQEFLISSMEYKFLSGLFYGFMLSLCLYNLFLFFSIRERMYLYYVFYIVSFLFYQGTMNTLDLEWLRAVLPAWILERSVAFMYHVLNISMILFGREFLATKSLLPKMDRVLSLLSFFSLCCLTLAYLMPEPYWADTTAFILGYSSTVCLWLAGLRVMLKGSRTARLYLMGWSILLVSIALQGLTLTGILPFHPAFLEGIPALAVASEAIILSFALADKINTLKKQREEEQCVMNEKLASLAAERTKLFKLSTIDSLTELYNRYKIEQYLKKKMEEAEQTGSSLAVILMDIDNFKQVNDHYGHIVGDRVLSTVAKLMKSTVRETDLIGRWGGEEFMIICPHTMLDEAIKIADRLRQTIEQHPFPIVQQKTCSFGISCFQQGDTVEQLVSRADKALYHAKQNGRNRVEVIRDGIA